MARKERTPDTPDRSPPGVGGPEPETPRASLAGWFRTSFSGTAWRALLKACRACPPGPVGHLRWEFPLKYSIRGDFPGGDFLGGPYSVGRIVLGGLRHLGICWPKNDFQHSSCGLWLATPEFVLCAGLRAHATSAPTCSTQRLGEPGRMPVASLPHAPPAGSTSALPPKRGCRRAAPLLDSITPLRARPKSKSAPCFHEKGAILRR